eukprot:COSAG03_NODE_18118_length_361_cov_1.187023_1_plen_37_part_01
MEARLESSVFRGLQQEGERASAQCSLIRGLSVLEACS